MTQTTRRCNGDGVSRFPWLMPILTAGLCTGIAVRNGAESWAYGAYVLLAGVLATMLLRGRGRSVALFVAAAGVGSVAVFIAQHPALPAVGEYTVTGVVVQEIALREDGQVQTVLTDVTLDGQPVSGDAYWTWYLQEDEAVPEELQPGKRVAFSGRVYHPSGMANPGGFNFREYLLQRGVLFGIYGGKTLSCTPAPFSVRGGLAAVRHALTERLMLVMGQESGAYAAAMMLGNSELIKDEDTDDFRRLGLAHVLVVSGYHVGVLVLMMNTALHQLQLEKRLAFVLRALLLTAYAILTGAAAPVVRAVLLALLHEAGRLLHRRNSRMHLLCASAMLQLLSMPLLLMSASFQMTYGAMLGLYLVYPKLKECSVTKNATVQWLWDVCASSVAVHLGILPAQLYWFGDLPLFSVFVNVAVAGLISFVMVLYWTILAVMYLPGIGLALGKAAGVLTDWMMQGIHWLADIAGASLWVQAANAVTVLGWVLIMLAVCIYPLRWLRIRRSVMLLCGIVLLIGSLIPVPNTQTVWMQFSVGDEDAGVLLDGPTVTLVDVGEDGDAVAKYLLRTRREVDTLILTHLHSDHAGGIRALLSREIPVKRCCLPVRALEAAEPEEEVVEALAALEATGTEMVFLARGDELTLPSGRMTVLWPVEEAVRSQQDGNDSCLVLLAELHGSTMLLTGDLTGKYEMYCAQPVDILKAAHHGSGSSTSAAFLEATSPQLILLSTGDEEQEAAFGVRAGGIPVYSTRRSGAVSIRFREGGFSVEPFLQGAE